MYTLTSQPDQILREDGAIIPFDEGNVDYWKYQAWLAEGNEPAPYEGPPTVIAATVSGPELVASSGVTFLEFMEKLTAAERLKVAGSLDPNMRLAVILALASDALDAADVEALLEAAAAAGIFSAARVKELAGEPAKAEEPPANPKPKPKARGRPPAKGKRR